MKQGLILFLLQFVLNFIGTVNIRTTVDGNYLWTAITDLITALLGFGSLFMIIEAGNWIEKGAGFTVGAVGGSLLGIYVSKKFLKK